MCRCIYEAFEAPITHLPGTACHTVILLILWIAGKSRNRKVFDNVPSPPRQLASMIGAHCTLWLHCLPKKLHRLPMETWCVSVCEGLNLLV